MRKKIIIAIIVAIIIVISGLYIYTNTNRTSSALESFKSFVSDCNKFQLKSAKTYINKNSDLSKGITQIEDYNQVRKSAVKNWLEKICVNIVSTKKEGSEAIIVVEVLSPNGNDIYNDFQKNMNELDINSQTIQDNNFNGDFLGAQYNNAFSNAINENINNITQTKVEVKMKRSLREWKIENDNEVIKALLGGLSTNAVLS